MKIALIGYGNMGKEIEAVAKERGIPIAHTFTSRNNADASALTRENLESVDVCIDFSSPSAVIRNIEAVVSAGTNIVVGTTGWHDRLDHVTSWVAKYNIGLLHASNFSLGVALFAQVVQHSAQLFDRHHEYDVALSETHHRGKVDSPSGTALSLANVLLQQMKKKTELLTESAHAAVKPHQLHVSSTRVGHVTGRHRVIFDSDADSIELVHTAKNRRGYAVGALIAAEWLKGRKGVFTMKDVIR